MSKSITSHNGQSLKFVDPKSLVIVTDPADALFDTRADLALTPEFLADVALKGILQPILINRENQIIAGRRRTRAALAANLPLVPALIRDTAGMSRADVKLMINAENNLRTNDTPAAMLANAKSILEDGGTLEDIARTFVQPMSTIRTWLSLDEKAVPEVKALFEAGTISTAHIPILVNLEPEIQKEAAAAIEKVVDSALVSPEGKAHANPEAPRNASRGDVRIEKDSETGALTPRASLEFVKETAAKAKGAPRTPKTIKVVAAPAGPSSDRMAQREMLANRIAKMESGDAQKVALGVVAALQWTQGKKVELNDETVAAILARIFPEEAPAAAPVAA